MRVVLAASEGQADITPQVSVRGVDRDRQGEVGAPSPMTSPMIFHDQYEPQGIVAEG